MLNTTLLNPFSRRALRYFKGKFSDGAFAEARRKLSGRQGSEPGPEEDAQSFFVLLCAGALRGVSSPAARAAKEVIKKVLASRIWGLLEQRGVDERNLDPELLPMLLEDFTLLPISRAGIEPPPEDLRLLRAKQGEPLLYALPWKELLPALRSRRVSLARLYISRGYALLTLKQAIACYLESIAERCDEFMRLASVEDPRLEDIAVLLEEAPVSRTSRPVKLGAKRLKEECFPPCIRATLAGVGSGSRNYAITVLLTSFISYARIAPFNAGENARIADFVRDLRVVTEEVLPVIYAAAERCSPPLFEDQPLEKLNINYHLGFGLTEELRLEDSGRSPWYFVPNCEKIRREAPSLCSPDRHCRDVRNPLVYYTRRRYRREE